MSTERQRQTQPDPQDEIVYVPKGKSHKLRNAAIGCSLLTFGACGIGTGVVGIVYGPDIRRGIDAASTLFANNKKLPEGGPNPSQTPEPSKTATPRPADVRAAQAPSKTVPPTATTLVIPTSEKTAKAVPVAQVPTTVPPTEIPTSQPLVFDTRMDNVWEGLFVDNNIRQVYRELGIMIKMQERLTEDYRTWQGMPDQNSKDAVLRMNATLAFLVNPFSRGFDADPARHPGLGQKESDIQQYMLINNMFSQNPSVDQLGHVNENGLFTIGVYGDSHNRDTILATIAVAELYRQNPDRFKSNGTPRKLKDVVKDPAFSGVIKEWQKAFLGRTQKESKGVSAYEDARRKTLDEAQDLSNALNPAILVDDQWVSCDNFMGKAQSRNDQRLGIRQVNHKANIKRTFTESETENKDERAEHLLYVYAKDAKTGIWEIYAFTDRGYQDPDNVDANQIYAAVGEAMFPCAIAPVRVFPKTAIPQQLPRPTFAAPAVQQPKPQEQQPQPPQPPQPPAPEQPKSPAGNQVNPNGETSTDRGTGQQGGDAGGSGH